HTTVGDNLERMEEVFRQAVKRADLIITTGGTGPTLDDLTKTTVAKVLGLELVLHEESAEQVKSFFHKRGRQMPESNLKQAYFPRESRVIPNHLGTAPGVIIEHSGKIVIILPGPPFEMKPMFEETVEPYLRDKSDGQPEVISAKVLKVFGIGESTVEEALADVLTERHKATLALLAKQAELHIRISATAANKTEADQAVLEMEKQVRGKLGDKVFAADDQDMADIVGGLLAKLGLTMATAESCTGGLIGGALTAIPGSSSYYLGGFITYSNGLKVKLLGVNEQTLADFGAVSPETAREMAAGARKNTAANLAVSVTGIAGPGGGSETKPVGLVYVGLAVPDSISTEKYNFWGDRQAIRALTVNAALDLVRRYLIQYESANQGK
ncbi:MAG TPA: competence/damage-inducible protein A, partial [Desulfobacteria bacterium]|nr:competence/damage-inducible protein A [Desulfobacteria bacterium]